MFESIFTSTADNSINISQAAISLGASIVIGVIIAIVYMYICKKEGYQKNFIIGLLMLQRLYQSLFFLWEAMLQEHFRWQEHLHL